MAKRKLPEQKANRKKVLIVDDHPMVRERLSQLINREADLVTCGEAEDASQALSAIEELKPDIAIVDLTLKQSSGMALLKDIKERFPRLPVLVLSMHDESLYAERALRAGARGYITKQEATQKVMAAIRQVLGGNIYLSDKMSTRMLGQSVTSPGAPNEPPVEILSDQELEIFERIGRGQRTRLIAQELHLGMKTVDTYRTRIKKKLNLGSGVQLQQYATRWADSESKSQARPRRATKAA